MKKRFFTDNHFIKKRIFYFFIFLIVFLCFILIMIFIFFNYNKNKVNFNKSYIDKLSEGNYLDLIKELNRAILQAPFNVEFRLYRGISFFLQAEEEKEWSKRKNYLTNSLIDLRKAYALGVDKENLKNIFFIVGKIYFYFGEAYYSLSLKYLDKAKNMGLKREDLYYTLSILYSYLGNYKKSLDVLLESLKIGENDILFLAIANAYYKLSDYSNAKEVLNKLISNTNDTKVKVKAYFLLGEIFFNEKNYDESLNCFNNIIELDENNAEAYYYRGEIFSKQNNLIKARAEWRKVLEINPGHINALKRIYK